MAFMDRLKSLRTSAGLTQEQLAEKSGISRGGIRNIEQGIRSPAWETVQALAKALGVDCRAFQDEGGLTVDPAFVGELHVPKPDGKQTLHVPQPKKPAKPGKGKKKGGGK